MTWSGYLLDLVVFFEFGGAAVAQGAVQPGAVVPGDVLDDRPPGGSLGGPGLKAEELALDRGEKRFRKSVVPALAGAAMGQLHRTAAGQASELGGGVLGEFNWSSQRLDREVCEWGGDQAGRWQQRGGRRCGRRDGRRWRGGSTGSGSGRRSRSGTGIAGPPGRRPPGWRRTSGCASMCRTGWPA